MSNVKELLNFSEEVGNHYSLHLENELKDITKELEDILYNYLKNKCIEEDTVINNSVHKSMIPFSLKTRVKSKESLEEKVIRNDIKFSPIDNSEILTNFDDLIGITILTTTIGYHDLAHRYFINLVNETEDISIIGVMDKKKPLFGNNRIQYYHLKLLYKNYPVEIQIKSVFLSAFADIEHTLFYKDFDIYELKSYNKKIMHSLAPILIDLEDILHEIYTQDNSYIELEFLKTKIYKYINKNKIEILELEQIADNGKLNYSFKLAAEMLTTFYLGKDITIFDENMNLERIDYGKDHNIINMLFDKSVQYSIIRGILGNNDKFFENYLRGELKNDDKFKAKITFLDDYLVRFVDGLNYIAVFDQFNALKTKNNIKLKLIFNEFIDIIEKFNGMFEDQIEVIDKDVMSFVDSCFIISSLVEDIDEFKSIETKEIFKFLLNKEENEELSLDLSDRIQEFIIEEWDNK